MLRLNGPALSINIAVFANRWPGQTAEADMGIQDALAWCYSDLPPLALPFVSS